eukprot:Gb_28883 [translate_table: standard]
MQSETPKIFKAEIPLDTSWCWPLLLQFANLSTRMLIAKSLISCHFDDAWKLCFIYDELLKVVSDMRKECATQLEQIRMTLAGQCDDVFFVYSNCFQQSKLVQKLQLKLEKEEEHCSDLTKLIEKLLNSSLVLPETNSVGRLLTSRYLDDTARKYLDESVSSFESHLTENQTRTLERHFCNENIVSTSRPRAVGSCQSLYPRESCPNVPVQVFNSGDLSQEHSLCSDDDILAAIQLGHSESSMIQPVDSNEITLPWLLWETELDVPSSTTMQVQKDFQRFCRSNNNNTCIEIAALPGLCDSDKETDSIKGEDASVLKTRNDTNGIQNPKLGSNSIQTKVFQEQDRAYLTAEDFLMDRARYKTSVESGCLILCMGKLWYLELQSKLGFPGLEPKTRSFQTYSKVYAYAMLKIELNKKSNELVASYRHSHSRKSMKCKVECSYKFQMQ